MYLCLTFKNPHSCRIIIYSSGGAQSSCDDGRRRDEIIGKGVIEIPLRARRFQPWAFGAVRGWRPLGIDISYLKLKNILHTIKLLLISVKVHPISSVYAYTQLTRAMSSPALTCRARLPLPIALRVCGSSHLAVNSSKLSSWLSAASCPSLSTVLLAVVLKLLHVTVLDEAVASTGSRRVDDGNRKMVES